MQYVRKCLSHWPFLDIWIGEGKTILRKVSDRSLFRFAISPLGKCAEYLTFWNSVAQKSVVDWNPEFRGGKKAVAVFCAEFRPKGHDIGRSRRRGPRLSSYISLSPCVGSLDAKCTFQINSRLERGKSYLRILHSGWITKKG